MSFSQSKMEIPHDMILQVFGPYDTHVKKIEDVLDVSIVNRGNEIKLSGEGTAIESAKKTIEGLIELTHKGIQITEEGIDYYLSLTKPDKGKTEQLNESFICTTINGKYVRPKTVGQKHYIDLIREKMIVLGIGPAGTGKTYLAMAMAITAFKKNEVNRIILTRPVVEAGEKLGFLPGDLQSKVDPYLRPLYDALHEIMGAEAFLRNMEKGLIEVAPLAYMRGRTLNNAFIVLDEAQNTTPAQMKMFLTRIGFGSKAVITGDLTQKDLSPDKISGLEIAIRVVSRIEEIGIAKLTNQDVVRHPIVQKIVDAYDLYESHLQQ